MIAVPISHLALHKETLKQHFEKNNISIKHLIKIIHLGAINSPVGRNGLISTSYSYYFLYKLNYQKSNCSSVKDFNLNVEFLNCFNLNFDLNCS